MNSTNEMRPVKYKNEAYRGCAEMMERAMREEIKRLRIEKGLERED